MNLSLAEGTTHLHSENFCTLNNTTVFFKPERIKCDKQFSSYIFPPLHCLTHTYKMAVSYEQMLQARSSTADFLKPSCSIICINTWSKRAWMSNIKLSLNEMLCCKIVLSLLLSSVKKTVFLLQMKVINGQLINHIIILFKVLGGFNTQDTNIWRLWWIS